MSRFIHIHVDDHQPAWVKVETRGRCTSCGVLVTTVWRWYATPLVHTHDLCEPCVERLLKEA